MHIFLTGSTGFIGRHLKTFLFSKGHEVFTYQRNNCLVPELFVDEVWQPDLFIHCAAELKRDDLMFDSNVVLTNKMLKFARDLGSRFIQIGSSSEYGPTNESRREGLACLSPNCLYDATKLAATNLALAFSAQYGMDVCVVRPSTVYGHGMRTNFLPMLWESRNKEIEVWAGAHDWIYIDDFLDGLEVLMNTKKTKGQIYNLGTGISTPNINVAFLFQKELQKRGMEGHFHFVDKRNQSDVDHWRINNRKMRNLGWKPKVNLKEGLRRYVDAQSV